MTAPQSRAETTHPSRGFPALWPRWLVLGAILAGVGLAYWLSPAFRASANRIIMPMANGDLKALENFILSFGWWAPVVSFLLMILQTLIAPLPAFVLAMANAMLFGFFYGFLLTWLSALVAAFTAFYLSRWLGRPFLGRTIEAHILGKFDGLIEDYGAWAVLVLRFFPVISFDVVSFAAGLTAMRWKPFGLATFVGMLPATIAFTLVGKSIHTANKWTFIGGAVIVGLLVITAVCMRWSPVWRNVRHDAAPQDKT